MNAAPQDVFEAALGLGVSRESLSRIEVYVDLLLRWQARINLIAPSTIPDIWHRHVLDSLQVMPLLPRQGASIADLGSGGGFPALPLAIANDSFLYLYESNLKKAAFLREALRQTNTAGEVRTVRLESLADGDIPRVDVVTARALAPLASLLTYAEPFLRQGAKGVFHKGQDVDAELTDAAKSWRLKFHKHQSLTDSRAVILEVEEVTRVEP